MKAADYSIKLRKELRKMTLIEKLTLKTKILMLQMILDDEIYTEKRWGGRR